MHSRRALIPLFFILFYSCKTPGPGIFGKKSPHELYGDKIRNAGLNSTVLGQSWITKAEQSILKPLSVQIPYSETGYFTAERPQAAGLRFEARQGQKLTIRLDKKPALNFTIYIDLWRTSVDASLKHIAFADTLTNSIQHEVEQSSGYILRIQPELLTSGEYTLSITAGPSLAYPIKAPGKNHIQSFWGADREGGARKHEGIDLFASLRTPVVAAADGKITRVEETNIGGKVVWMRPENRDYTLYYAHLDAQLVSDGQNVKRGDTLGLMGNTGNARYTSPHLHFGIYTFGGPVDPFPFVNPVETPPESITGSTKLISQLARNTNKSTRIYSQPNTTGKYNLTIPQNTMVRIESATSNWYKISLPDGQQGFIHKTGVTEADKSLRKLILEKRTPLFEKPDSLAAKKTSIPSGEPVDILGNFQNYYFINTRDHLTGWITK